MEDTDYVAKRCDIFQGGAIMGDGAVAMIVDIDNFLDDDTDPAENACASLAG